MKRKLKMKWKIIFTVILVILAVFLCARFIGTKGLVIREYKVVNTNIGSFYGLKIVHFSDLHYGMSVDEKVLEKLVNSINETKPDIVVFTGDLVDRDTSCTEDVSSALIKYLSKIKSTYGNYYVEGNHDLVNNSYTNMMESSNFKSLNNTFDTIYNEKNDTIFISGMSVDDSDISYLKDMENPNYKIFVMHYPDNYDEISSYDFDLVLAGHSHNGQVRLPFIGSIITPENSRIYKDEYYKVNDTDMYISGGIGNSVINLRLFNKPSFNLYRIVDK